MKVQTKRMTLVIKGKLIQDIVKRSNELDLVIDSIGGGGEW